MKLKAFCANCKCKGTLHRNETNGEIVLLPQFWEGALFWNYFKRRDKNDGSRFCPAEHGFDTVKQQASVVGFGSIFWISIMLVLNVVNYERTKFKQRV